MLSVAILPTLIRLLEDPPPTFSFSLDTSQLFSYAQGVISSMSPVIYMVAGISLGFMIVARIMRVMR